jgi:hypothetical protein
MFTPFHKPPYPYLYGRSVDETTTICEREEIQMISHPIPSLLDDMVFTTRE